MAGQGNTTTGVERDRELAELQELDRLHEPKALQIARGLEEMAAWLREHPAFPVTGGFAFGRQEGWHVDLEAAQAEFVRYGDEMGAHVTHPYGSADFRMEREFSGGVTLHLDASAKLFEHPWMPPLPDALERFAPKRFAPKRLCTVCQGPLDAGDEGTECDPSGCPARVGGAR
jgi:hypothetical protein